MEKVFERLAAANISILPVSVSGKHIVFERDGFVALVERTEHGFGAIGSAGKLTGKGFATLIWRGESAFFVAKGFEEAASTEVVATLRIFQKDLEAAIRVNSYTHGKDS